MRFSPRSPRTPQSPAWLVGLAHNPAAPASVTARLRDVKSELPSPATLPDDFDDVMLRKELSDEERTAAESGTPWHIDAVWRRDRTDKFEPYKYDLALAQRLYALWGSAERAALTEERFFHFDGLARYLDHPRPYARLAAVEDPAVGGPALAALLRDQSPTVRRAVRRERRLPWPYLRPLLETHPEDAAANPGLPPEVMHRLLDISGLPFSDSGTS
ncbi:hypothetical protein [Yinghuangia seranimata]|uniref:hypothetical protein n=1 Tax=Yinghuangia seranimata TaxID=408067 RepID=UPI00248D138B|nr:hypothetical protein [Yinghuangia seranimata]MDI2132072.1 hypothetical protein [Yinghuangia seranimata]